MTAIRRLSIIIPVYNEAQTIDVTLGRVDAIDLGPIEKEVIVVDDGSTDGSAAIIANRMAQPAAGRVAHLSIINLGKGAAVRFGFKYATGDVIMIQDADLELDPAACVDLIQPILDGKASVVYGSRFVKPSPGVPRRTRIGNHALTTMANLMFGCRLTDMETAYKVFTRDVLTRVSLRCVGFDIEPEITARVLQAGYHIVEVPITYKPRRLDEGKKVSWTDGIDAVYTLLRCRFMRQRGRPAAEPAGTTAPLSPSGSRPR